MKLLQRLLLLEDFTTHVRAPRLYQKLKENGSTYSPVESLLQASKALYENIKTHDTVTIATGFPIRKAECAFENDGPIGAVMLAKIIDLLGATPVFLVEKALSNKIQQLCNQIGLTFQIMITPAPNDEIPQEIINDQNPMIIIEKPGPSKNGEYLNIYGEDISKYVLPISKYVKTMSPTLTISIGDSGNEYGSGNMLKGVSHTTNIEEITTFSQTTTHILAGTSNLGSVALSASLVKLSKLELSYDTLKEAELVQTAMDLNLVDGVKGFSSLSVDGFSLTDIKDKSKMIWDVINKLEVMA